jgi:Lon protease-like protein
VSEPAIPERLALFPLPNVVLFPDARLPLHMFEPRYRQLAADALAGERVIGMVLLRPEADASQTRAPIFEVGCAGRISESQALPDGRYNLVLDGARRFHILEEEPSETPYRVARSELLPDPGFADLDPAAQRVLLGHRPGLEAQVLELALRAAPRAVDALRARLEELDPVQLVHAMAFGLNCGFVEKQGLLEADSPVARCELLLRLLEFHRAETELGYTARNVN